MSLQIILSDLSFSYSGTVEVLKEVSLTLSTGWTGVVGANGSGKTTLLRILAGEVGVDPPMLQRVPGEQVIRYCPQQVGEMSPSIRGLAQRSDGTARRIMGMLELDPPQLHRWPSLSPGERKRWQIASALANSPDVLLLDEPTGPLDATATAAVEELIAELLKDGASALWITHDPAQAKRVAGRARRRPRRHSWSAQARVRARPP